MFGSGITFAWMQNQNETTSPQCAQDPVFVVYVTFKRKQMAPLHVADKSAGAREKVSARLD